MATCLPVIQRRRNTISCFLALSEDSFLVDFSKLLHSLEQTAKAPENRPFASKRTKKSSSNHPFSGATAVSFRREGQDSDPPKFCLGTEKACYRTCNWIESTFKSFGERSSWLNSQPKVAAISVDGSEISRISTTGLGWWKNPVVNNGIINLPVFFNW